MPDAPLIQLIRAEMQRFSGRQYQIAFDQFDARSLHCCVSCLTPNMSPRAPSCPSARNQAFIERRNKKKPRVTA